MAKKAGARYLDSSISVQKKTLRGRLSLFLATGAALIAIFGTVFMGALVAYSSADNNKPVVTDASAFINMCGVIGQNMDGRSSWRANWDVALADANNRRFTLAEVVPNSTWWSHFTGTNSDDGMDPFAGKWNDEVDRVNAGRDAGAQLPKTEDLPESLKGYRTGANCTLGAIPATIGSFGLNFANFVTKISSFTATMAFNSSFICDADQPATGSGCIDLISVIGGRSNDAGDGGTGQGSSSGIIGSLTSGLYMPLMIIVVLVTALTVFWTGIVKRRYRDALFQALWLAGSVIIGLALLLNPSMLVKAPMVIGNTVVGCVVGSFNGSGCTGGNSNAGSGGSATPDAKENVCVSNASGLSAEQTATLYVNGMSCAIWSAFVLEPYAQGAFGLSLGELNLDSVIDASSGQTVRELLSSEGWSPSGSTFGPDSICVNLQTTKSYNSMGNTFTGASATNSGTAGAVCNLAVWDLFMKTNAVGGGVTSANNNPDNQWVSFMSRLPANEDLFKTYVDDAGGWGKLGMGSLAAFASLLGSLLIITVSVLALVYYIIAIIMVAFAPVFFLFGMHPGRGRKIMLGWLEQVVGNILKYIISAVFLLIAITFYGAILGTSTDLISSLLFVTIVTMALWMYRKELINILSRVEMGGEKMTDMADTFMNKATGAGSTFARTGKALAAGTIAGAATGAGTWTGFQAAAGRELRRGNGLVARTWQAADAISTDNENDLYKTEKEKRIEANAADKEAKDLEKDAVAAIERLDPFAEKVSDSRTAAEIAQSNFEKVKDLDAAKQELNSEVSLHFVNGEYGNRRADKEITRMDKDGNLVKTKSSEAFSQISDSQRDLNELRAARKELFDAKDHEGLNKSQIQEKALIAKIDAETTSFRQDHRLGGAANAYAGIRQTEALMSELSRSRDSAVLSGDTDSAQKIGESMSTLKIDLDAQQKTFTKTYGAGEFKRAGDEYDKTATAYIKHADITPEKQAIFAEVKDKTYDEINRDLAKADAELMKARESLTQNQGSYENERDRVSAKVADASRARTDAAFRDAEADSLSQAREDFTPGDITSLRDIRKIEREAESVAGVQAGRSAQFGLDLTEAIKSLNEKEKSGFGGTSDAEILQTPVLKGQALTAAEQNNAKIVNRGDREAVRQNVRDNKAEIIATEREIREADRLLNNAAREDQVQLPNLPKNPLTREGRENIATANKLAAIKSEFETAEAISNDAASKRAQANAIRQAAEAKIASLQADASANPGSTSSAEIAKAQDELDRAEKQASDYAIRAARATSQLQNIKARFDEARTTAPLDEVQRNRDEVNKRAEESRGFFKDSVRVPLATMESLAMDPRLQNSLSEVERKMNELIAAQKNGAALSLEDRAKMAEIEKRFTSLGEKPSAEAVKRLEELLPKSVEARSTRRLPTNPAEAARPRNFNRSGNGDANDINPPSNPSR